MKLPRLRNAFNMPSENDTSFQQEDKLFNYFASILVMAVMFIGLSIWVWVQGAVSLQPGKALFSVLFIMMPVWFLFHAIIAVFHIRRIAKLVEEQKQKTSEGVIKK